MIYSPKSRLEDADRFLYRVDLARYDIKCDPMTGRSDYLLTVTLTKKKDKAFTWYTRFEKDAKAEFIGANITNPNINTTHQIKLGNDGFLEEIAIIIPDSIKSGQSLTLSIHYKRNVNKYKVTEALGAKRILLGMFCALASECTRLEKKISFESKKARIISVLTPAERNYSDSEIILTKDNLAPQQFTPVTILLDTGNYRLLQLLNKVIWAFVTSVISFILGMLIKGTFEKIH